ncbi:MAG: WhiB family transcriptional regulator [Actinomycetia bacterium]|nr:WhiB family transcriptional regulator [Actinomycetes bacterium]
MSPTTCKSKTPAVPCHVEDGDLWFAEDPRDLEKAKVLCRACPIRRECLNAALERQEPWGVWGGEILERGTVVARKRPRGRPRKNTEDPVAA